MESWKAKARKLKSEVRVLYLAYKDPRTPWYAKVFAVLIIGYALSPIDLIPDFIPVLGYVDDSITFAEDEIFGAIKQESRMPATELRSTRVRRPSLTGESFDEHGVLWPV